MNDELNAFRAELQAAGEPYSRWGARTIGIGLVALICAQILARGAMLFLGLAILAVLAGWAMLIVAHFRRRAWAKAHPMVMPGLSDPP
jgi:hypothetical protein